MYSCTFIEGVNMLQVKLGNLLFNLLYVRLKRLSLYPLASQLLDDLLKYIQLAIHVIGKQGSTFLIYFRMQEIIGHSLVMVAVVIGRQNSISSKLVYSTITYSYIVAVYDIDCMKTIVETTNPSNHITCQVICILKVNLQI